LPDGGPFTCGIYPNPTVSCTSSEQYCVITIAQDGVSTKPDASVALATCDSLPLDCQPIPTCNCVSISGMCTCADDGGYVTVTCE